MSFYKFRILFWKNWTLQKRRPISGILQILFPIFIVLLATWARYSFGNQFGAFDDDHEEIFALDLSKCIVNETVRLNSVFFTPNNAVYRALIEDRFSDYEIQGFIDESSMIDFMFEQEANIQSAGISLLSDSEIITTLPRNLTHRIIARHFARDCILAVQNELEIGFIKHHGNSNFNANVTMQTFPYEHQFKQIFTEIMMIAFPIFLVFSLFSTVSQIIKSVAAERESKMKELMKIMGLSNSLHWLSWFVKSFIMSMISYTIVTIFLCIPIIGSSAVFSLSNFFLIWLFFMIYCIGVITFCFMISTMFTKASIASNVGVLLFFSTYVPYYVFGMHFEELNYAVKWLFCLPINTALGKGISMALNMELNREGITFSNLFTHIEGFGFSFFEVLMTMLIASVIHLLVMTYIELVFPGDVGVPKKWYFPVACLIRGKKRHESVINDNNYDNNNVNTSGDFEEEPKHLKAKVRIENMTKKFGNYKAVNNLSLNIYEDQITVLLAHNGGGKTTTMNCLIVSLASTPRFAVCREICPGVDKNGPKSAFARTPRRLSDLEHVPGCREVDSHGTPKSSAAKNSPHGSRTIYHVPLGNDYDITKNIVEVRKSLGICPQHNILFGDLTVREHIIFFCRLKGMKNSKEIEKEVEKYMVMMEFVDKKNTKSIELSGGQQRKLSIANALCGNSSFVILDEPSAGLDTTARRNLWDLLIEEKKGRTILLSTHYMDEAEAINDRIAIMNEGRLKTVGTSFFLKKKFGSGYRLIIVKKANCDSARILDVLREYAPDVTIESEEQMEVSYVLSEEYLEKFSTLFKRLEDNLQDLCIESFGCSLTSLEDVFLKIGAEHNEKAQNGYETAVKFNHFASVSKVSSFTLFINQVYAMLLKKLHFTRRNYADFIIYGLLTAWLTFVFLAAPMTIGSIEFMPQLTGLVQTNDPNSVFVTGYKSLFDESNVNVIDEDIRNYIFRHFIRRNHKYQIGTSLNENSAVVWFNFYSFDQTSYVALNFHHRAVLREMTGVGYDINLLFNPFTRFNVIEQLTDDEGSSFEIRNPWEDIPVFILFFFILTYWPSIHITLRIQERMTKAKLLQFISGINGLIFNLTAFLIDYFITLAIMLIFLGAVFAFNRPGFNTGEDYAIHATVFTFYILNMIPMVHVMAFWFSKDSTGEAIAQLVPFAFMIVYVAYAILEHGLAYDFASIIASIIYWIAIFFAPFNFIDCSIKILGYALFGDEESDLWGFGNDGLMLNFLLMAIGGIVFQSIIIMKDYLVFMWIRYKLFNKSPKIPPQNTQIDDDVSNEIQRVKSKTAAEISENNLILNGLSKFYGKKLAVNNLHVGVESGESFGLLGINGAGKTSVFKMLTADEIISSGSAWIHGYSLINQVPKVYREIGYCPQHDALLTDLSGRETLKIFCLIRGIPRNEIDDIIEFFAYELDFTKHLDKKISDFSGGNKRKISTALSLIGSISLVFLDECSSGIDVKATRQLWNIINKTRNSGKAIVITSHSMQECESLCTKLAIMVDGEFRCLGSIQHLKHKFSKGFILKIMLSKKDDENHFKTVQNRVIASFPNAQLKERFMGLLTFHIDIPELKWSSVFAELAEMKVELGINDYTMTQSSLESVFLFFSKQGKNKSD